MQTDRFLTPEELSQMTGIKTGTYATWRVKGGGPEFVKVGARVRYRLSAVEAWLSARTMTHTA